MELKYKNNARKTPSQNIYFKIIILCFALFIALYILPNNNEGCELTKLECFPIKNNDFAAILSEFREEEILRSINEYSRAKKFFRKNLEFRIRSGDREIGLFALERIFQGTNYLFINLEDFLGKNEFYKILNEYQVPLFEFDIEGEPVLIQERLRLCFVLHYHLANLHISSFQGDLIGLPKYPTSLQLTMPLEAIQLMDHYERAQLLEFRKKTKEYYNFYKKMIRDNIPDGVLSEMLNETQLSFPNFVYCLSIFDTRATTLNPATSNPKKRDTVLIPSFHYINKAEELTLTNANKEDFTFQSKTVSLSATEGIFPEGEILRQPGAINNWKYLEKYGRFPIINEMECLRANNNTLLPKLKKIPSISTRSSLDLTCLKKNTVKLIYTNINFMNLDSNQTSDCLKKIKDVTDRLRGDNIIQHCPHVEINQGRRAWSELKREVLKYTNIYNRVAKRLEISLDNSHEKFSPNEIQSYNLIIKYYLQKLQLVKSMKEDIFQLEEINQSLKEQETATEESVKVFVEESCDLSDPECFPAISENDFAPILSSFSKEDKVKLLNEYSRAHKIFDKKLEYKESKNGGVSLFASEFIAKGSLLLKVSYDDFLGKEEFSRIMNEYQIRDFEFKKNNEAFLDNEILDSVFVLHYHLANIWKSKYLGDLVGLQNYNNQQFFALPIESIDLIPVKERNEVLKQRKIIKNLYQSYSKAMRERIPEKLIATILNGTTISFANFAFCISVIKSRSAIVDNTSEDPLRRERESTLVPGLQNIKLLEDIKIESEKSETFSTKERFLYLNAHDNINIGAEVFNYKGNYSNSLYMTKYGYIPNINEFECIDTDNSTLIEAILMDASKERVGFYCLQKSMIKTIYKNILLANMESSEAMECQKKVENITEGFKSESIMNLCPQNTIRKGSLVWASLKEELKNYYARYSEEIKYLEILNEKSLGGRSNSEEDESNWITILKFYKEKEKLIKAMILEMRNIEALNPSLKRRDLFDLEGRRKASATIEEPACDLSDPKCFPTQSNEFTGILSHFTNDEILRNLNEYSNHRKYFKVNLEFQMTPEGSLSLFSLDYIPTKSNFISIPYEESLGRAEYYKILDENGVKRFDFLIKDEEVYNEERLRGIFLIHYHLANLWSSKFIGDLMGLPKYSASPAFKTPYDAILLMRERERDDYLEFRKKTKELYKYFIETVKINIPEKNLNSMFNGTRLSFENFVYCLSVFDSRAYTFNKLHQDPNGRDTVLVPALHYINRFDEVRLGGKRGGTKKEEESVVHLFGTKSITSGSEILLLNEKWPNWKFLLNHGSLPKVNEYECVHIENKALIEKLDKLPVITAKQTELKCLRKNGIDTIYAKIKLMSMQPHKSSECLKKVSSFEEHMIDIKIRELCPKIELKKGKNIWVELKEELLNSLKSYENTEKDLRSLQITLTHLTQAFSPEETNSFDLVLAFYGEKVKLINRMIEEINLIESSNPSLVSDKY